MADAAPPSPPPATPHARLRALTGPCHQSVDDAFARFDLGTRDSYLAFLTAHARALPAVEAVLAGRPDVPPFRPRAGLLRDDLAQLGAVPPAPLPFDAPADEAEAFGTLYVIEGSRLGGGMLARQVPPDLPRAYLSAIHLSGEWRRFCSALDEAALAGPPDWLDRAEAAARRTFALYERAAAA